jgi:hypothetical protein
MNSEPEIVQNSSNEAPESPASEKPPQIESDESKKPKRGGKRAGAGRKPNLAKRLARQVTHATAGEILGSLDTEAMFRDIFKNGSRPLKLQAWIALNDRYFGKPKQDVGVSGGLVHAHVWRPLSALNDEEIALLDKLTKKLSAPASDASPDAHQNQIESKPALEAEVVASGA